MNDPNLPLRVLLLAALAVAAWLVRPFADAVIIAMVVTVLAWPIHQRVLRLVRGRRAPAALLSLVIITVCFLVPAGGLLWLVTRELAALVNQLATELASGDLVAFVTSISRFPLVAWVIDQFGGIEALTVELQGVGRDSLTEIARSVGQSVPGIVGLTARALLKILVFLLTLGSLLHRGEALLPWAIHLSPLRSEHTQRLFQVFAQFARNVVLAGIVAASVQGLVAGIGYLLVGIDRPLLFAVLTGVLAFVPLVGTAAAWVPVALLLLLQGRVGAAVFVALWSILLTGTVDNLVKPLVVRGKSDMPTVLVFLGVFGGLAGFGIIGLLVGPVIMAVFLALLRIYEESLEQA